MTPPKKVEVKVGEEVIRKDPLFTKNIIRFFHFYSIISRHSNFKNQSFIGEEFPIFIETLKKDLPTTIRINMASENRDVISKELEQVFQTKEKKLT